MFYYMNAVIFISFSVIAAFMTVILIEKKNKKLTDIILAAWFFAGFTHAILYYLFVSGISFLHTAFLGADLPLVLVHGPFLYIYVCATINNLPKRKYLLLLHFIPAVLLYLYQIPFFTSDPEAKIQYIRSIGTVFDWYSLIKFWLIIISGIYYISKSALILRRQIKKAGTNRSQRNDTEIRWIKYSVIQMILIWMSILLLDATQPEKVHIAGFFLTGVTAIFFIVFMSYFGLTRTNIYICKDRIPERISEKNSRDNNPLVRYRKSGLKNGAASDIEKRIISFMETEKPYLKNDITLSEIAKAIGISQNHLSQVINERMNCSFWDFINTYRIAEFKSTIGKIKNKQETILSLAFRCGFNSKSSFNTIFKKAEGISPREFLKTKI
jgi:AraC-like DNA-binding protein